MSSNNTNTMRAGGENSQFTQTSQSATQLVMEEELQEKGGMFRDFLTSREMWSGEREYTSLIREMLKKKGNRLIVNINDLRQFNRDLVNLLLQQPIDYLPTFEKALKEVVLEINEPIFGYDEIQSTKFHIGIEGSFGELHTNPRHLSSRLLSHMICLDGIVTSCSLVRPKLIKSVHYSDSMKTFLVKEYWDSTMLNGMQLPGSMSYPTEGEDKQKLTSEFGLSQYRDYQTISIQEMPEKAPPGQLPRSVDIILDDDLVDRLKPGDRAQVVGVYKSLATAYNGQVPSTFRAVLVANNVRHLNRDAVAPQLSTGDVQQIKSLSRRTDIFDLLSRSLAPSIYGHEYVKKAVALLLLGGVEKNISNDNNDEHSTSSKSMSSTHIRGDINLMLVGDPSTAKSQMLRFVLGIAPLAIATTGRGSSGVGLTAAVTSDKETGERRLEAGAMVLADRGIVCIDEFDKMNDTDRVAIHEVMEQQTVTIAKAGIHASLNARCSVLAAANPIWGQYRETASPQENIRLPDSLLSRFDLLFIILDRNTPEHDRHISQHVLKMHRYVPPGLTEGSPIPENALFDIEDDEDGADENKNGREEMTSIFQRRYTNLSNEDKDQEADDDEEDDRNSQLLTIPFIKKYMFYARSTCTPVLTKSAAEIIVSAYTEFRQKKEQAEMNSSNNEHSSAGQVSSTAKTFPVTPRTLETLIRLATAHAKARLSSKIEKKDARIAQEMVEFCLYQEVKKKPSKKSKKVLEESEGEDSDDDSGKEDDGKEEAVSDEEDTGSKKTVGKKSSSASSSIKIKSKSSAASAPTDIWDPELTAISDSIISSAAIRRRKQLGDEREAHEIGSLKLEDNQEEEEDEKAVITELDTQTQTQTQSQDNTLPIVNSQSQSQSQSQTQQLPFVQDSTPSTSHRNTQVDADELSAEDRSRLISLIRSSLHSLSTSSGATSIPLHDLSAEMKRTDPVMAAVSTSQQIHSILDEMQHQNIIYFMDSTIYII